MPQACSPRRPETSAPEAALPARNLLGDETSPYLLQHKDNPVHWRAWGEAAFAEARATGRPILLSVGYAACHWCHVMAHESFEDEDTAARMNELFVNVKVDREERPDVDTIYQHALALLGEHGGWPLTMFLTPEGEPFWGGTYFPKEGLYGRPPFRAVLDKIAEVYREKPEAVRQNADALKKALTDISANQPGPPVALDTIDQVANQLLRTVDRTHGGIGGAPKFPQSSILELLWRAHLRTGEAAHRDAVLLTLDHMCQGGIYDHLGGGFARYTVDAAWLVPHFEKMLYDNAQILDLLVLTWQDTRHPLYRARIEETVGWVLREMVAEGGGFASSLDADSEGEEGKFYVWTEEEIDAVLGDDASAFKDAYDVTPGGNWEGKTILNRLRRPQFGDERHEGFLDDCRARLLAERDKRVRPGWDDKVLADWNGLMIAALARAGAVFGRADWIDAAVRAFGFVRDEMTRDGRLMHAARAGKVAHPATLDDYANMIRGGLALYEATGQDGHLATAIDWARDVDAHFHDAEGGGYFFTADDVGDVLLRTKTAHDSATPAGNAVLAADFARLHHLTGDPAWRERADGIVTAFSGELQRNAFPLATLLNAAELSQRAVQVVVAPAGGDGIDAKALLDAALSVSEPNLVLQRAEDPDALPADHPAHGKGPVDGAAAAYVCRGMTCSLPITQPAALAEALRGHR